jgi:Subtilase family
LQILALNNDERNVRSNPPAKETKVLVLDTGFTPSFFGTPAFPQAYLEKTRRLAPLSGPVNASGGGYVVGVNLQTSTNDPNPIEGDPNRWHGIGVAGAVLGGHTLESLRRLIPPLVKISVANVVNKVGTTYQIDPSTINRAYRFAQDNDIAVINASMTIPSQSQLLDDTITKYGQTVLFVTAAGNDGADLSATAVWPAAYGGDPGNAKGIITP